MKKKKTKPSSVRRRPPNKPPTAVGTSPDPSDDPNNRKSSFEQALEELEKPDADLSKVADLLSRDD